MNYSFCLWAYYLHKKQQQQLHTTLTDLSLTSNKPEKISLKRWLLNLPKLFSQSGKFPFSHPVEVWPQTEQTARSYVKLNKKINKGEISTHTAVCVQCELCENGLDDNKWMPRCR